MFQYSIRLILLKACKELKKSRVQNSILGFNNLNHLLALLYLPCIEILQIY